MMFKEYQSREELMEALAERVAIDLADAINAKGKAAIALPGGTTPAPFLRALSQADLDWDKVIAMPGDERFVDEGSDRSNAKLLRENFLINKASRARLIRFVSSPDDLEASVAAATAEVERVLPIDVVVVGMGEDMHTASLFPDSDDLEAALEDDAPVLVPIHAPNAGEARISLSAPVLRAAAHKHILITGENKKAAHKRALEANSEREAPVRVLLVGENPALVHYAD